jgi:hypothetical protein
MKPQDFVFYAQKANRLGQQLDGLRNMRSGMRGPALDQLDQEIAKVHTNLADAFYHLGRKLDGSAIDPQSSQGQFMQSGVSKHQAVYDARAGSGKFAPDSPIMQASQGQVNADRGGVPNETYAQASDPNARLRQYAQPPHMDLPAYGQENVGTGKPIHGPWYAPNIVRQLHSDAHDLENSLTALKNRYEATAPNDFQHRDAIIKQIHDTRLKLLSTYGRLGLREDGSQIRMGDTDANSMRAEAVHYRSIAAAKAKAHGNPNDFDVRLNNYKAGVIEAQLYGTPMPEQPYPVDEDMRRDYAHYQVSKDPTLSAGGDVLGAIRNAVNPAGAAKSQLHKATDREIWDWEMERQPQLKRLAQMKYGEWLGIPADYIEKSVSDGAAHVTDYLGVQLNHEQPNWFLNDKEGRASQGKAINGILHLTPIVGELLAPADMLKTAGEMIDKGPIQFAKDYAESTWGDLSGAFDTKASPTVRFNKALTAVATAYGLFNTAKEAKEFVSDQMIKAKLTTEFNLKPAEADAAIRLTRNHLEEMAKRGGATKEIGASISDLFNSMEMRDGTAALANRYNSLKAKGVLPKTNKLKGSLTVKGASHVEFPGSPNQDMGGDSEDEQQTSQHLYVPLYQKGLATAKSSTSKKP